MSSAQQRHLIPSKSTNYIFIELCDREIINADSGEKIINLSQFMVAHNLDMMDTTESYQQSQLSQQLVIDGDYFMPNQQTTMSNQSDQANSRSIIDRQARTQSVTHRPWGDGISHQCTE